MLSVAILHRTAQRLILLDLSYLRLIFLESWIEYLVASFVVQTAVVHRTFRKLFGYSAFGSQHVFLVTSGELIF